MAAPTQETSGVVSQTHSEPSNPMDSGGPYLVKLKGLPYDATKVVITQFLSDCQIKEGDNGVKILLGPDCRASGEALVVLSSHADLVRALNHDRNHIGTRYVEVMYITKEQFDEDMQTHAETASSGDFIVRLRGLPYSAQVKDVFSLLSDCTIKNDEKGIHFSFSADGRPSGEAFVELCSDDDVEKALCHNHEHMGRRYVEVFRALRSQMEWDLRKEDRTEGAGVIRLRGLPYGCVIEQINTFLAGINIVPGGITFQRDEDGRETGGAFVELCSETDVEKALTRDRKEIQHRYIEVFRSSHSEVRPFSMSRPTPYSRPGGRGGGYMGYGTYGGGGDKYGSGYEKNYRGGRGRGSGRGRGFGYGGDGGGFFDAPAYYGPPAHGLLPHGEDPNLIGYPPIRQAPPTRGGFAGGRGGGGGGGGGAGGGGMGAPPASRYSVRMRGLPYSTKEKDVVDFFLPLVVLKVNMSYDQSGRPSGEAEVYFPSHEDATAAMQKNNQHIGHRYIELFLNSSMDATASSGTPYSAAPRQGSWRNGTSRGQSNVAAGAGGYTSYANQQPQQQAPAGYQPQQQPQQYQQNTAGYAQGNVGYQQGATDGAGYGQHHQAPTQQQWGTGY